MTADRSMERYFWDRLGEFGDAIALIDEQQREKWSYRRLAETVVAGAAQLQGPRKKVVFLFANNDAGAILCYMSALAAGHLIYLGRGSVDWTDTADLLERYRPDIILWKGIDGEFPFPYRHDDDFFGYRRVERRGNQPAPGSDLALLLSTSGSLGSPKLVRLSRRNVAVAASQVAKALGLERSHRAITSLPLNFVYGLSVVHSHLQVGASLVLTRRSVQDRAFWQLLDETKVTSFAAVPWTLRALQSISFDPARHPSLRSISLSGGALEPQSLAWLKKLAERGLRIFSMYGQTEASGRMCVLPCEELAMKPGSVGLPVEGSSIRCDAEANVVFQGPNVMLGYARRREDLTDTDDLGSILATGDRGYLDEEGYLYITGRTSRIAKLFGLRINLDEIEAALGPVVVACDDGHLTVFVEKQKPDGLDGNLRALLQRLRVPEHCARIEVLAEFPRNEAGKIRYAELQTL